ncbi:MAG: ATP synthase F1 subunit epsilon [Verrucomicrobiota bacterium]
MAHKLRLEIVTPNATAYSEDVDMVVLPGIEGEMGIYPMHVPLMTELKPGELRIVKDGQETALAVGEGFAQITGSHVSVLTDLAIEESAIDERAVESAIARAEASMRNAQLLGDEELATVEASLEKSLAQLKVKRRRRG